MTIVETVLLRALLIGERGVHQITQDEDPQPEILDAVSHQLQRVAESSMDDGHLTQFLT
jgi:hypothetical protein